MKNFIVFLVVFFSINVQASDLKEVTLVVELGKDATQKCQLSSDSVRAQIEAVIRQNNLKIIKPFSEVPVFYVQLTATPITIGGSCYGHAYVQVFSEIDAKPKWSKTRLTGVFEHCLKTFSFTGRGDYEMQTTVNNALADLTRQCVSKMIKQ
jgi:uncharacterized protein (UPF0210 family)